MAAAFAKMLDCDRKRSGLSVGQAAWRLGVKPREYRELESGEGWPTWETWDRMCRLFGWPRTFAGEREKRRWS
jgi:DNA-binding XRE family transcriptional regulator